MYSNTSSSERPVVPLSVVAMAVNTDLVDPVPQSFADLLKFVLKEPIIPASANKGMFLLAPLLTAVLALASWAVIPFGDGIGVSKRLPDDVTVATA